MARNRLSKLACLCLPLACLSSGTAGWGQSPWEVPQQGMRAEPIAQNVNPFLPHSEQQLKLPVMLQGFCVVTLRERQQWQQGLERYQLVFDGKLYWFAGERERGIFAANPSRYIPALGGDCLVTFVDQQQRVPGNPANGLIHQGKLCFFRSETEKDQFIENPARYALADLANSGMCLVSQVDENKQLPGLPETTVYIDGLRYQFAGVHRQQKFLSNTSRYGVTPPESLVAAEEPSADRPLSSLNPGDAIALEKSQKKKPPKPATPQQIALGGYCPVSIHEKGVWTLGEEKYRQAFDGQNYLMAGAKELEKFRQDPHPYIPALGGYCVVTEVDRVRRVPGSIYHATWHEGEGRLFLFAGAEEKEKFKANPDYYLQADLIAEGKCIVTLLDEGLEIPGLPELTIWHNGKRYLFASEEEQARFKEQPQRYAVP